MRVLVAEDDSALRSVLERGLRENGYVVDAVPDGQSALDYLRIYDYEVAVLDWRMPGRSGLDVVGDIRRQGTPLPVLMLTARDSPGDRITGLDEGADDYLVKPFDFGELLARLRALQRRAPAVRSPRLTVGDLEFDPATRGGPRGRGHTPADRHRAGHPRGPDAPLAGHRAAPDHRPERVGGGGRRARLQHDRRAHRPAAGEAGPRYGNAADRPRRRIPAGARVRRGRRRDSSLTRQATRIPGVGRPRRAPAVRVAAVATLIIAVVYLAAIAIFNVIADNRLLAQVDTQLTDSLGDAIRGATFASATAPDGADRDVRSAPV